MTQNDSTQHKKVAGWRIGCATLIFVFFILWVIGTLLNDDKKPSPHSSSTTPNTESTDIDKNLISYETLETWNIPAGGIGMDILVHESATKNQIINLANALRKRYLPKGYVTINIFDSREVWQNRYNPNYPQSKYDRHFVAQVMVNPRTGYDKVTFEAKGRAH